MGSLAPDSASSRWLSRRGRPTLRSTENTAAASVDATTAPISSAVVRSISSRMVAAPAVTPAVMTTPMVASDSAGMATWRTSRKSVLRPPS